MRTNRRLAVDAALVWVVGLCATASAAQFAGGDGTLGNPYQITNAQQLLSIGSDPQLLDRCFVLNNDIDFDDYYGAEGCVRLAVIAPHTSARPFGGWLDGKGHVIRHLRIKTAHGKPFGLIGLLGAGGTVLSLGVEDSTIEGEGDCVGLIAGVNSGTILGCWAGGRVKGGYDIGLLVGWQNGGTTAYSHSEGSVDGRQNIGGLIARVSAGEVLECSSDCRRENTSGQISYCGGLVGRVEGGTIEDSFARVSLVGPKSNMLAGLVGFNEAGVIRTCLALGTILGDSSAAGLVGVNNGTIRSCYSLCRVEATSSAGGLVCRNGGTVMLCYAEGVVKAPGAGGLIREGSGAFLSYWDVEKSGVFISAGGFGRTAAQMRQAATFRGWGRDGEWVLPDGETPRLWWEPAWGTELYDSPTQFAAGSGTADDPYQIGTAAEFASLAWDVGLLDKHFVLTQDVNLAELDPDELLPIGTRGLPFCGSLDGRGHVLSGLVCNLSVNYAGLFGCVGASRDDPNRTGCVRDLVLHEARVTGADMVGALASCLDGGGIERCFVTGQVQGLNLVGGVIGEVTAGEVVACAFEGHVGGQARVGGLVGVHQGVLRSCYSAGEVASEEGYYIGGLVGQLGTPADSPSWPLIAFCYSQAQVQGDSSVGGLVGSAEQAEIFACYATGKVHGHLLAGGLAGYAENMVTWGSVWDRDSTGMSASATGQAQTTAAMKVAGTYVGWEYGGQWTLKAGADYPRLAWETRAGPAIVDPARTYGGGAGTHASPYLISQAEHLVTLSRHPQDFAAHFRLAGDIDLQSVTARLSPIGALSVPFTGSFDGNYHTLENFKYTDTKAVYAGLFRSVERAPEAGAVSGVVSNLHLKGAVVKAAGHVGALAARNNGEILFCTVSDSTISADGYVGGLVAHNATDGALLACESGATVVLGGVVQVEGGFPDGGGLVALNEGSLMLCSSSGSVLGSRDSGPSYEPVRSSLNVGGVVGVNRGTITGCTSTSRVSGASHVGGLVGANEGGWLYRCGATGDVDTVSWAGGLAASSVGGTISACFARGKVKGLNLGGFIWSSRDDVIESCYFQGSVSGTNMAGFIGEGYGQSRLRHCYCATDIIGVPYSCAFARSISASVQVSGCFWDSTVFPDGRNMQSLTPSQAAGLKGLDTESLKEGSALREAGWDFTDTWVQCDGDYPRLWWEGATCGE